MNNEVSIDAGDDIVQDYPISSPEPILDVSNREGLNDIQGAKKEETQEYISPGRGNRDHDHQKPNHLINNDVSAILGLEDNLSSIRDPYGNTHGTKEDGQIIRGIEVRDEEI